MSETMEKAKLKFEVRAQKDPTDPTKTIFVPAIVERNDPMSLAGVIYNAIDTGRIAGLKPNAAKAIAEGICDQMYQEILKGNGIAFEKYFYIRLYLDGTVEDASAQLSAANRVNVRLTQGSDFRVGRDDFAWTNIANDKSARLDYIVSGSGVRGEIQKLGEIYIDGAGFGEGTEGVSVRFVYEGGEEVEGTVASVGPNRIAVDFPAGLADVADGTEIAVTVIKRVDGTDYPSNSKSAVLVAAAG